MQTIITPTDFSDISLNAVKYAADMAMELNASLLVLHATEFTFNLKVDKNEIDVENRLNNLRGELINRTNNKIKIHSKQVFGIIENELMKMCEYKNPLAVVMATHGTNLKEQFFIGSVTVYLSKTLKYPVIVVPSGIYYKPVKKILLTTDLENLYNLPIEKIANVVSAFESKLDILHVYDKEDKFEMISARMCELTNYLKSLNPEVHVVKSANVYAAILNFAYENNSDLILTFPKKHAFFHKSESKQLMFNAPFAVMTM